MASPLPNHLSRKATPQDVSTQILTKVSETTIKELTASLAASWILELEDTIKQTKDRIHDRTHNELPAFEHQLASARSVQTRLHDLSTNVDTLADSLSNDENGLLPTLLRSLSAHAALKQEVVDAGITHSALEYLTLCSEKLNVLGAIVEEGRLPEASKTGVQLQDVVDKAPEALASAEIMADVRRQTRVLRDRAEEQLSNAYSRSIRLSSTTLHISPSVKVQQSESIISLSDILASLSPASLNPLLASLKRDLISHYIEYPLQQPVSSSVLPSKDTDGTPSHTFSLFPLPSSPHIDPHASTVRYLRNLFDFLSAHLFSTLPALSNASFLQSLSRPTTTALLRYVLIPSLPSSLMKLPPFLALVEEAVRFEEEYIIGILHDDPRGERDIKTWADNVPAHYGRKRRTVLLESARALVIVDGGGNERIFRVEVFQEPEREYVPEVVPIQGDINGADEIGWDFEENGEATAETADGTWGFEKEEKKNEFQPAAGSNGTNGTNDEAEEDAWDFEESESAAPARSTGGKTSKSTKDEPELQNLDEDPSDAWGWDEGEEGNEEETTLARSGDEVEIKTNGHKLEVVGDFHAASNGREESAWDDPWDDPAQEPADPPAPSSPPSPQALALSASPAKIPKVAKRLEKFTSKGKSLLSPSLTSSTPASPFLPTSPSFSASGTHSSLAANSPRSSPTFSISPQSQALQSPPPLKPRQLSYRPKAKERETFAVSGQAKDIIDLIKTIFSEGQSIAQSTIFSPWLGSHSPSSSSSSPSTLVLQTAPYVLDLYRALYPITFSQELKRPGRAMKFSNDCGYISEETRNLRLPKDTSSSLADQMYGSLERLKELGEWWFDEGIERLRISILQILDRAEGFVDTGDQERFDECESVMSDVLRTIRSTAFEWKTTLSRTSYYRATGQVVEAALTRILNDVLALPDIPELDSRKLSELCRILNAFEGLFVDNPNSASMVVAYVPSWLKYSYLSELLEASIADISYLFDEGALIDFDIAELVSLVKALFAESQLRTNTIAKLQRGHPVSES